MIFELKIRSRIITPHAGPASGAKAHGMSILSLPGIPFVYGRI